MKVPSIPVGLSWYELDVQIMLERLQAGRVLIIGGRGTGKSSLLARVAAGLAESNPTPPIFLAGRDTPLARRKLRELTEARASHETILIDDLDVLLTAETEDSAQEQQDTVKALWALAHNQVQGVSSSRSPFLATASIEFQGPLAHRLAPTITDAQGAADAVDAISRLRDIFGGYPLNPWPRGWGPRFSAGFDAAFSAELGDLVSSRWKDIILNTTGGHTGLCGPAVSALAELVARESGDLTPVESRLLGKTGAESGTLGEEQETELREEIRYYVEDLLSTEAVRPIRSALRRLRTSSEIQESNSYLALVEIARLDHRQGAKPPSDPNIRRILLDEALVVSDPKTGHLRIPGTIIEGLILQSVPRGQATIELVGDQLRPDEGELRIRSSSGVDKVTFKGAPWRVLRELYRRPGELVSAAELKEKAVLPDNDRSVANAIQRILSKLKDVEHAHLIVNEYNKGYKFLNR